MRAIKDLIIVLTVLILTSFISYRKEDGQLRQMNTEQVIIFAMHSIDNLRYTFFLF